MSLSFNIFSKTISVGNTNADWMSKNTEKAMQIPDDILSGVSKEQSSFQHVILF